MKFKSVARRIILPDNTEPRLAEAITRRDMELANSINILSETTWDDLRFEAGAIDPAGLVAAASRDTSTGMLSFAGNLDNSIGGLAQFPHAWKSGTIIRPHIHLVFPTSNTWKNTRWKFEYNRSNVNADLENNYGTYSAMTAITVANPANAKKQVIASFGDLTMAGYIGSTCMLWKVTRLAQSDAADDDTNAAILLEFDIHFQINRHGSYSEIPTT